MSEDLVERLRDWGYAMQVTRGKRSLVDDAADEIERLRLVLWSMASNVAPKHPDDTHVVVYMPIEVWREVRP